ncbi:DUF4180 domain-containing protein [Fluviicola taffensis]|uniref:DUF4180 domain-containing protein n=1 Tax=Fluviicola taffensis (strain DSM 16823 / NCIMB 13979 / RW262) TaxID=755732 RepID=F2IEM5_FLUTR|nr:DUF4180 domain-containing protein [Fluviicola taffensis]AEA44564.1 hypothetical protein Fluta_2580 [Fluviicola taffensis DSM 16823]
MHIESHETNGIQIAEITSDNYLIEKEEDGVDLLGNLYYQGFDRMIIYEKNINPTFFDLKNGMAGEMLQKFSNYRMRLVIVGDFSAYTGKSITDFMYESNQGKQVNFLKTLEEALDKLAM